MARTSYCLTSKLFRSGVFFLKKEQVYHFGRDETSDIVLPSGRVSRRHAKIHVVDERHYLVDLNSTNGTRVNDSPIGPEGVPLENGDRIEIGPFEIVYRAYEGDLNALIDEVKTDDKETTGVQTNVGELTTTVNVLSGSFDGMGLIDTCQFLAMGNKDGLLTVHTGEQQETMLFFDGKIVHTSADPDDLESGIRKVLHIPAGRFTFENAIPRAYEEHLTTTPVPLLPILMEVCRTAEDEA